MSLIFFPVYSACEHNRLQIVAGVYDRTMDENTQQRSGVEEVYVHPDYNDSVKPEDDSDISLLKLKKPLKINDYVKPVHIAQQDVPAGTKCLASGWGLTIPGSQTLLQNTALYHKIDTYNYIVH